MRTNQVELLDAASAIRNGEPPKSHKIFRVQATSNSQLAGSWVNGNLQWYCGGKSVAVITTTLNSFSRNALIWASQNRTKSGSGPYTVPWEESESNSALRFLANLPLEAINDVPSTLALLSQQGDVRATQDLSDWMERQRRSRAKTTFSREEIHNAITQGFVQRRRSKRIAEGHWKAMTVHGAKNREFDNVILLWPAATGGDADQKRRLLYNALTRAKERCLVLVQAKAQLGQPPFA